ncbi:MAG: VTT domain-containing protein [Dehalococcoidales bacterium]
MAEKPPANPERMSALTWLKKRLVPLSGLLFSVAIVLAIVLVYKHDPDIFTKLGRYGYAGAFVISVVLNGTILFPVSNVAVMIGLGATLPLPWLVGVAGGFGAAFGEMTGYLAGRSGRGLLARSKVYIRVEGWVKKWGWLAVFIMAIFPFAFDVVGIIAGALRMPVWRFFVACWLGRTIFYVFAVYLTSMGIKALPWFG